VATFEVRTEYNPERRTAVQIVPALIGVILNMTMVIFTAAAIVRERERGQLRAVDHHARAFLGTHGWQADPVRVHRPVADHARARGGLALVRCTGQRTAPGPVHGRGAVYRRDADARAADLDRDPDAVPGLSACVRDDAAVDPAVRIHVPVRRHAESHPVVRADTAAHAFCRDDPRHRAARRAIADLWVQAAKLAVFLVVALAIATLRFRKRLD
jgi:hypothetical protein